ncbi:hypothetical protein CEUSTIGMA_g2780.t1 [Chlamydomonas eustigma]|uniref:RRM domain-containing protein n=1 Tax=Chlamydomonas eustigma TaxID=1157962 RepID=A0A250WX21_9CHLO|nr:hypothetical protein CEUSTIGMA_g2780.t1 [Chlamydomonas eustigma]|eukprot:GAX75335.1 hypothetical protein CEUSTIGMA_g2780.t1 [Chlamydomonas eustigma]
MAKDKEEEQLYEEGVDGEGYENEIPIEGSPADQSLKELEAMKKKLQEMEAEAALLKSLQAGTSTGAPGSDSGAALDDDAKAEVDARSVFVGNVDYSCTPEELQQHFQACGTVNRVTILTDKFGNPKAYAYIEFLEVDAVANAILLDGTELRGRPLKVGQKRTNVPGLKFRGGYAPRGGRGYAVRGGYGGRGGRGGYYGGPPARGGYAPRGRGRGRFYAPY